MALTSIEWTAYLNALGAMVPGYTFNAWLGCDKVSPACRICYITRTPALRFRGMRHGDERQRTAPSTWAQPLAWNRKAEREGVRPRVFTNSLADWLDDEVPIEWLADLLLLIFRTPNLDWLLLTKRPQNFAARVIGLIDCFLTLGATGAFSHSGTAFADWLADWARGNPPANVWIGTTVEDQTRADERIPILLSIPAKVRFLSCEPLLEQISLVRHVEQRGAHYKTITGTDWLGPDEPRIHWVIAGGESGDAKEQVKPSHPKWFRILREECEFTGTPFFFKQWGDWKPADKIEGPITTLHFAKDGPTGPNNPEWHNWPDGWRSARVGKKAAGRLLDGHTHDEFPATTLPQPAVS